MSRWIRIQRRIAEFGLWGVPLLARWRRQDGHSVLLNSIPKAGTNLGVRVLYLMEPLHRKLMRTLVGTDIQALERKLERIGRNQFAAAHLYYSEELEALLKAKGIKHVFFIRDPRDIAVSNYKYIAFKDDRHRLHSYFRDVLKNDNERLLASIEGIDGELLDDGVRAKSIAEHVELFMGWTRSPNCHVVRFEDIVGPRGGGSREVQVAEIEALAKFLDLDLRHDQAAELAEQVFDVHSRTFAKGTVGGWKSEFTEEHLQRFNEMMGGRMKQLGYGD